MGLGKFFLCHSSRNHLTSFQKMPGNVFASIKQPEHEAGHSSVHICGVVSYTYIIRMCSSFVLRKTLGINSEI
jgi:hypothetical protein